MAYYSAVMTKKETLNRLSIDQSVVISQNCLTRKGQERHVHLSYIMKEIVFYKEFCYI